MDIIGVREDPVCRPATQTALERLVADVEPRMRWFDEPVTVRNLLSRPRGLLLTVVGVMKDLNLCLLDLRHPYAAISCCTVLYRS
jgi:hypothetical protein